MREALVLVTKFEGWNPILPKATW